MSASKHCPKCNEQVDAKAKKCKHCQSDMRNWFVRHKIISTFLILIVLSAIGNAFGEKRESTSPQQVAQAEEKVETVKVTAVELGAAYEKNEISADNLYKGKTLKVSGAVDSIGKDIVDSMYVTLKTGQVLTSVQCMLKDSEESKAASLSEGQRITVVGKGNGKLLNVMLRDCQIQ